MCIQTDILGSRPKHMLSAVRAIRLDVQRTPSTPITWRRILSTLSTTLSGPGIRQLSSFLSSMFIDELGWRAEAGSNMRCRNTFLTSPLPSESAAPLLFNACLGSCADSSTLAGILTSFREEVVAPQRSPRPRNDGICRNTLTIEFETASEGCDAPPLEEAGLAVG